MQNIRLKSTQLILFIVFSTSSFYVYTKHNIEAIRDTGNVASSEYAALVEFLLEQNLKYGYATYWNAGILSVLSNGTLAVRPVILSESAKIPVPYENHSSLKWYRGSSHVGESFLILRGRENEFFNELSTTIPKHNLIKNYKYADFNIYVYDENLANLLKWNEKK